MREVTGQTNAFPQGCVVCLFFLTLVVKFLLRAYMLIHRDDFVVIDDDLVRI